ncbi:taste receptor type 2 member 40-like [Latimeria chalumnae]|nr:PREDICTED: taste receptor type 2 member 4-like [Latimeria chalumnae]|eukprot:XP_006014474.1 PREDICTED: taste receptor type 2 member 4-like [Latimeria chalumnae]
MNTAYNIGILVIATALTAIGAPGNLFILAINLSTVRSQQVLPPTDLIISGLALSGIVFQTFLVYLVYMELLGMTCQMEISTFMMIFYITDALGSVNFWFISWLCIFYCAKIVRSGSRLVIRFQQWINGAVRHLLAWSAVGSFTVPVCYYVFSLGMNHTDILNNCTNLNIAEHQKQIVDDSYYCLYLVLCCLLPLVIMTTSSSFILLFLRRHAMRMQRSAADGFSSPSSEAHVRVSKMVLSLMGIYTVFDISIMIFIFTSNEILVLITILLCYLCPGVTPVIIIWGTAKLRNRLPTACWSK